MYDTPNVLESPCLTAGLSSPVRDYRTLGSITLGDTNMQNLTAEDILAMIGHSNKKTISANHAEVYYNTSSSGSCSYSDSTLQQSNASVQAPEALISSSGASHPGLKKDQRDTGSPRKNVPRKISLEDYYVQINMSVNEIRRGKRTDRMTAYFSVRDENDKKFTIFLRSSLTTSTDETFRSIRKTNNKVLEDALLEIGSNCPNDAKFFSGRLRYNPRRFKIEDEHKTNLKSAVIGIYDYGDRMTAILFMLNEFYVIELGDDLTSKQQGTFDFTGSFQRDIREEE
jgi:hypothetical protein